MKFSFGKDQRQGDEQLGRKDKRRDLKTEGKCERCVREVQKEGKEGERNGER